MAETIVTNSIPATVSFQKEYGGDVGDNWFLKAGAVALGGLGGYHAGKAIGGDKPLGNILGSVIGVVAAYKIIPEIATDIQRGNQYVDQQAEQGKSEGNLLDRFKAVGENFLKFGGQSNIPGVVIDADPDIT